MSDTLQLKINCRTSARTAAGSRCLACVLLEVCMDLVFASYLLSLRSVLEGGTQQCGLRAPGQVQLSERWAGLLAADEEFRAPAVSRHGISDFIFQQRRKRMVWARRKKKRTKERELYVELEWRLERILLLSVSVHAVRIVMKTYLAF